MDERDREGIAILKCKGRLVMGTESETFRDRTRALIDQKKCCVILSMNQIDHIDSSGLGELISFNTDLKRAGGRVMLVELNQRHVDLLVMTKLSTVFEIFSDEQDAINNFFPERRISRFDLLDFVSNIKEGTKEEKK